MPAAVVHGELCCDDNTLLGLIAGVVGMVAGVVFMIMAIVRTCKREYYEIPWIGKVRFIPEA